tara:strand:- start:403 stop:915 length:513 start_codon:yes stop_codon:yes gene_type:complete
MNIKTEAMMTDLSELIENIQESHAALRDAIETAKPYWEENCLPPEADEINPRATGDSWSPQQASNHVCSALSYFSSLVAKPLGLNFLHTPPNVNDAQVALESLDKIVASNKLVLDAVNDQNLSYATDISDMSVIFALSHGYKIDKTIEGALRLMSLHSFDHAKQIKTAKL